LTEGAGCPKCSSNRSNGWPRCTKHPDHPASGVCSWSGKPYCREELVDIDGKQVAKDNVTKFMQDERERLSRAMPPNPAVVISTSASPGFFAQVSNRTRMTTGVLAVLLATGQMVWKNLPITFKDRVLPHDQKDQPILHDSAYPVWDASSSSPSKIAPDSTASGESRKVPLPAAPDKSPAPVAPAPEAVPDTPPLAPVAFAPEAASDKSPAPVSSPEPETVFTVANLITAFESDKVAATKMLKGRRVTVRDVVEKFGKHDISLRNVSTRDRSSMKCHFNQDISGLRIEAGGTITVKGAFDKRESTGTIGLNDCAVVTSDSR
jgi:hypothetical protein